MLKGNRQALIQIDEYLNQKAHGPLIFIGPKGVGKYKAAENTARRLLCLKTGKVDCQCLSCSKLEINPDFLRISIPDGKKQIGVEQVEEILKKSTLIPMLSRINVALIDDMDSMNESAQNKLLKTLEDMQENIVIIGVSHSDNLLNTIMSRSRIIKFKKLGYDDFESVCKEYNLEDVNFLFAATDGCPGIALEYYKEIPVFKQVAESICSNPKKMFWDLHLVAEKDKDNYYKSHKEAVPLLIGFMMACYLQLLKMKTVGKVEYPIIKENMDNDYYSVEQIMQAIEIIEKHKISCRETFYTADSFFRLIFEIVSIEKGGK